MSGGVPSTGPGEALRRDRDDWWAALSAIVAAALAFRLIYLGQVAAMPFFDQPVGDSAAHLARAAEIVRGHWLPARPFYYCSIYYPYLLAVLLALAHGSVRAACLAACSAQVVAGVLLVGLVGLIARGLFGRRAGLAAATLAALYGPSAFFEADVLGVAWGQLALALAILACMSWARAPRTWMLFLAGLALGATAIERPNLLSVVPLLVPWAMTQTRGRKAAAAAAAAMVGGIAVPLSVALALNVAGTGQWVPLTTSAGINLALGYHPGGDGTYDEPWERESSQFSARRTEPEEAMTEYASRQVGRALSPMEASRYWQHRALEYIRDNPGRAALVTLRKAALMLNSAEVPNHLDFAFIRGRAPALWLMPIGFGFVLVLAVVGLGRALRVPVQRAGAWLLVLVATGAMLGVLPFTVADRYRAPMVPALVIAAGGGIIAVVDAIRGGGWRGANLSPATITVAVVSLLVTLVPLFRPLRGRDYWMFAQAYESRGDMSQAIAAYEDAVQAGGDQGELFNNLAMAYRKVGDRERAVAALRRAIAADPRLAYPHSNLGMLLIARGDRDSALAQLELANSIEPDDSEVLGAIGALLFERGDSRAARGVFVRALALAPQDMRLRGLVAHYMPGDSLLGAR
jgi:hypothetical protein